MITSWKPPSAASPPRLAEGSTLVEMYLDCLRLRPDAIAVRQKVLGLWEQSTWRDMDVVVREIALGLVDLGLEPGDCVSVLANTRREWMQADLAILCAGGVCSGVYPTDSPAQCEYLLADSRSRVVFVEDDEQLDKILEVRARLPELQAIVVFDMAGLRDFRDPMVMSLEQLRTRGRDRQRICPGRDPGLHLGYHRQAQGRHDQSPQPDRVRHPEHP